MTIRVQAIIPRGATPLDPTRVQRGVDRFLRDFSFRVVREMQDYPAARPWKHPPPKEGPRKGGRRTGDYGKGWGLAPQFTGNSVTLWNSVQYAVYVGGPKRGSRGKRQAKAMRERGWKSVSDVAPAIARELRPVLIRRITGGV